MSLFFSCGFLLLFLIILTSRKSKRLNQQGKFHLQTSFTLWSLVSTEVQKRNAVLCLSRLGELRKSPGANVQFLFPPCLCRDGISDFSAAGQAWGKTQFCAGTCSSKPERPYHPPLHPPSLWRCSYSLSHMSPLLNVT